MFFDDADSITTYTVSAIQDAERRKTT